MILTPWLMIKFGGNGEPHAEEADGGPLGRMYAKVARPLLVSRSTSMIFMILVGVATLLSVTLFYFNAVTVKLLPFDNKSEFQIIADLPEGSTLEETDRVLSLAAQKLKNIPELSSIQSYAGTAAPFNFNGLVRHYYLRKAPHMGDLQINLTAKHHRDRTSHQIALASARIVERPAGFQRYLDQGGGSTSWTACHGDVARGNLWPRCQNPPRRVARATWYF